MPLTTLPQVTVFTSPQAGSGAKRDEIPKLMDLLREAGFDAKISHSPDDLRRLGEAASQGESPSPHVVVAAGGDGTITLAASQLLAVDSASKAQTGKVLAGKVSASKAQPSRDLVASQVPIVPMPLGTENLLARHFGHQADAKAVLRTLQRGTVHAMDLGEVTASNARSRPLLTMATCGFDAEVIRNLHLKRKGHIRRASYFRPIVRAMAGYRFPKLKIETLSSSGATDRVIDCGWAMVFNLPCYAAGLAIEPDAIGDDGQFDVIAFHGQSLASGLRYVAEIKRGRHLKSSEVTRVRSASVRISAADRVHYQIDGDYAGRLPIEITMKPQAVRLLLPPSDF